MVLDHDENSEAIHFQDKHLGYLVCPYCRGYYELQEGESPDDFERCECGSPLEYQSMVQFRSRVHNPDLDKFSTAMGNSSYNEAVDSGFEDQLNSENNQLPDNSQIVSRLSKEGYVSEVVLTNIQEDKRDLWDFVDEYKLSAGFGNEKSGEEDVIEMDRFMMLVDQKRAIEENSSQSKLRSISHKFGPIGYLGIIIVLLITVLTLILTSEMI